MVERCTRPAHISGKYYRHVSLHEGWRDFNKFLMDMGERPPGTSIDRIDPNKGYEPGNCRWATDTEQNNNKRNSKVITYNGISDTARGWSERMNLPYNALRARVLRGWPIDKALTTPLNQSLSRHQ
jgi:hypothetical protein